MSLSDLGTLYMTLAIASMALAETQRLSGKSGLFYAALAALAASLWIICIVVSLARHFND